MKKALALLLLFLIYSCQYFGGEVPSKKELLDKELNAINWNEVDEFPSFSECDKIKDERMQKQCFFEFLTQSIQEKLASDMNRLEHLVRMNPNDQRAIQEYVRAVIRSNGDLKINNLDVCNSDDRVLVSDAYGNINYREASTLGDGGYSCCNSIFDSSVSNIIGGCYNSMTASNSSTIIGGNYNCLSEALRVSMALTTSLGSPSAKASTPA